MKERREKLRRKTRKRRKMGRKRSCRRKMMWRLKGRGGGGEEGEEE